MEALLLRHHLVPRPIAVLGLVGCALLLLLVVPLDLLGIVDEGSGTGLALLAPGGLHELLVLPACLIVKGVWMPTPGRADQPRPPAETTATAGTVTGATRGPEWSAPDGLAGSRDGTHHSSRVVGGR